MTDCESVRTALRHCSSIVMLNLSKHDTSQELYESLTELLTPVETRRRVLWRPTDLLRYCTVQFSRSELITRPPMQNPDASVFRAYRRKGALESRRAVYRLPV